MANRFVRVVPKIDYLGYDDFMKPLKNLQEAHDEQKAQLEAEEDVILTQLGKLNVSKNNDGNYIGVDAVEANSLQGILNNLNTISNTLASEGIKNSNVIKDARELWKTALPTYTKYEESLNRRAKEIAAQRDLAHRGYIFNKDAKSTALSAFTPDFSYVAYDTNKGTTFGEQYAKQQAEKLGYTYSYEHSDIPGQDTIIMTPNVKEKDLIVKSTTDDNATLYIEYIRNSLIQQGLSEDEANAMIQTNAPALLNAYNTGIRAGIPGIQQRLVGDINRANAMDQFEYNKIINGDSNSGNKFTGFPKFSYIDNPDLIDAGYTEITPEQFASFVSSSDSVTQTIYLDNVNKVNARKPGDVIYKKGSSIIIEPKKLVIDESSENMTGSIGNYIIGDHTYYEMSNAMDSFVRLSKKRDYSNKIKDAQTALTNAYYSTTGNKIGDKDIEIIYNSDTKKYILKVSKNVDSSYLSTILGDFKNEENFIAALTWKPEE